MTTEAAINAATLTDLEAIIDRGKQTFFEVGNALTEIRERKLYLQAGYPTFGVYCQKRHGFSASRGRQLIAAAAHVTAVTLSGGTPPATEREARALAAAQRAHDAVMREEPIDAALVPLAETGEALRRIRDGVLYREAGFPDFDTYCRERWGFTGEHGVQLIEVADLTPALRDFLTSTPGDDLGLDAARVKHALTGLRNLMDATGSLDVLTAIAHLCGDISNLAAEHHLRCERRAGLLLQSVPGMNTPGSGLAMSRGDRP
ncbi:MAG TPA: hypothetical protein VND88_04095 [Candidatus Acidoferrales bacterium]|nr:hypothetical protein [Candidatus Acidoferrales bacterium]